MSIKMLCEMFTVPGGELTRRLSFQVYGHTVQIIQQEDSSQFLVCVDDVCRLMRAEEIEDVIQRIEAGVSNA